MPPRNAPTRAQGPRGSTARTTGGPGRSGGTVRGGVNVGLPSTAAHVKAIGVKRREFGSAGRLIKIVANAYNMTLPQSIIYHYDGSQLTIKPDIFTPEAVYDGRKNMFASHKLNLGSDEPHWTLNRFIEGKQSYDEDVSTALNALHVAIRMDPLMRMPSHGRSVFTDQGKQAISGGLELWRGYFQSIRPSIGRMIINVDISTGVMYKPGPLIRLCLEFLRRKDLNNPLALSPKRGFSNEKRRELQRFLGGLRVVTKHSGREREYTVKKLSEVGANELKFTKHDGTEMTVANYFRIDLNHPLQYPDILCVVVGHAALPLEVCTVTAGQVFKNDLPDDRNFRTEMVKFSTMKPSDRFASIERGLNVLAYGQSQYIRDLGFQIDTSAPISLDSARVINGPKLKYGKDSRQKEIQPKDGAWNRVDKTFYKPGAVKKWVIVVFESEGVFNIQHARNVVREMLAAFGRVGISVEDKDPIIRWANGNADVGDELLRAGVECKNQRGSPPDFMLVILPDAAPTIYRDVKYFGDVRMGIATQCLKGHLCKGAKEQYWANIMLKVNAKLGGVNAIPDPSSLATLVDSSTPTIIMGADAMHPPPHTTDRPSYTSLVGSVDINVSHYVATSRVQASGKRRDIIVDLKDMCKYILTKHMSYREKVENAKDPRPKRIIFYRDGVSEGEFQQVIDDELPLIKEACEELKIQAKITLLVSVKRHHFRFKPQHANDGDRKTGNCPAGTVVDKDFGSPLEYDFFLLSHSAIQGTSRPTYYSVLHDEYGFKPDAIQSITYMLCHVYARSTRSVSIPAPVYYADIVCARAKNHYEPRFNIGDQDTNSTDAEKILQKYKDGFKPLHASQAGRMYFM
ncbi:argonaute-like protein, partial [Cyathus striatus]